MEWFEVIVLRTERIAFTVRASSPEEAEDIYLTAGNESGSQTVELRVESVERQEEEE